MTKQGRASSSAFRVGPQSDPDRYALGPAVGSGAEGILYRGTITTSTGLELEVAIKMLQPRYLSKVEEWHARWAEQVELLRSLQVPGVVTVRDGFMGPLPHAPNSSGEGTTLYLVMNWVDGEPLDEWVRHRPERDPLDALKLLLPVAAALDLMHSGRQTGGIPIVHRDLKPSNILVTEQGTVLVDFGLTRGLPAGELVSGVAGTPGYLAPETLARGLYLPGTDAYALGAVVYFVLTGSEPHPQASASQLHEELAAVPALASRSDVIEHVMAMFVDDPLARPVGLANWVGQLRGSSLPDLPEAVAPQAPERNPPQIVPKGPGGTGRGWRHKTPVLGAAALVAVVAVAVVVALIVVGGPTRRAGLIRVGTETSSTGANEGTTTSAPVPPGQAGSTSTVGSATPGGVHPIGPTVCRNDYVGYEISLPATGLFGSADSAQLGPCEALDWQPLGAGQDLSAGTVAAPIVITELDSPTAVLAPSGSPDEIARHTSSVDGRSTLVVEARLPADELIFKAGSRLYTYFVDRGSTTLVASLLSPPTDSEAAYQAHKRVLDSAMASVQLIPAGCHNSQQAKCGEFSWVQAPPQNQPIAATVTFTPALPHPGDTVTLKVVAHDPDADVIAAGCPSYGDGAGFGCTPTRPPAPDLLERLRLRNSQRNEPFGPWDPPPPRSGSSTFTFTHVYTAVGDYQAHFAVNSSSSAPPAPFEDPYASSQDASVTVSVR